MVVVALLQEGKIRGLREIGFIIQEMQNTDRFLAQHVQDPVVVGEGDRVPLDLLLAVLSLNTK